MSQQEHFAQVQQWAELEDDAERIDRANAQLQELSADDEFRASLEQKYPQLLAAWPGRNK